MNHSRYSTQRTTRDGKQCLRRFSAASPALASMTCVHWPASTRSLPNTTLAPGVPTRMTIAFSNSSEVAANGIWLDCDRSFMVRAPKPRGLTGGGVSEGPRRLG